MSEPRKECYECKYKDKCYENAIYDSVYCVTHRKEEREVQNHANKC